MSVSSRPSRSDAAAPGWVRASSSASTRSWSSARSWSSSAQAARSRRRTSRAVALGQVVEHVALLVTHAALHRRVDAEHVADGLAQRLGAVDDDEHALLDVQAALDEVGEQRGRDGGVLGRAVPEPERVLDAVGVDPERDDAAAALELDPVEHQHRQAQVVERAAHQLDQVLARARDELAADRRLARRARDLRRSPSRPARRCARSGACETPASIRSSITSVSWSRAAKCAYVSSSTSCSPSAVRARGRLDRHAPAAERDLAALVAVTHRGPVGIVPALRADDLVDLGLHQLVQHAEPDADAQRQQSLLRGAGELAERLLHRARAAPRCPPGRPRPTRPIRSSWRLVLLSSLDLVRTRHGPNRTGRGGRTAASSSTSYGTTSGPRADGASST